MRNSIKKSRSVGWLIERCRFGRRERAFAETWMAENRRESSGWRHNDILQKLFVTAPLNSIFRGKQKLIITSRDRFIVATVIQWLGTNIGWCFLEEALLRAGFKLVPTSDHPDREYYQPFNDKHRDGSAWNNIMSQFRFHPKLEPLPERQMTPAFKKKHLLRYRNTETDYKQICIRCGWIKTSDFNQTEKPCLWNSESINRRRENREIIDRPDPMPYFKIKQETGSKDTFLIESSRGMRAGTIRALEGQVIRLNGFTKKVMAIAPFDSRSETDFQFMAIAVISSDPPYGKTKS